MDKSKLEKTFLRLEKIHETIAKIFTDYRAALDKARKMTFVQAGASGEEIRAAEASIADKRQKASESALTEINERRDLLAEIEKTSMRQIEFGLGLRLDGEDQTANLLRENRMTAAWNRIKPILDREEDLHVFRRVGELVKTFGENNDMDSVAALKRELPLYLEGRSPEHGDYMTKESMEALDDALAGSRPESRDAVSFKRKLESGLLHLRFSLNAVESAIQKNELELVVSSFNGENFIVGENGMEKATFKNTFQL